MKIGIDGNVDFKYSNLAPRWSVCDSIDNCEHGKAMQSCRKVENKIVWFVFTFLLADRSGLAKKKKCALHTLSQRTPDSDRDRNRQQSPKFHTHLPIRSVQVIIFRFFSLKNVKCNEKKNQWPVNAQRVTIIAGDIYYDGPSMFEFQTRKKNHTKFLMVTNFEHNRDKKKNWMGEKRNHLCAVHCIMTINRIESCLRYESFRFTHSSHLFFFALTYMSMVRSSFATIAGFWRFWYVNAIFENL